MSSYSNPEHSNVPPGQGQPQFGPPPGEVQPYVEQTAPYPAAGGGQPPYQPPGAYMPAGPPQQPRGGRGAKIAIASILSVALLLGVGAVVLFKFVLNTGPDPAASFPASASMYVEVNFDPSFSQTPKLLEHLNKFEDVDYEDTDDILADLLDEAGAEGVEAEDLSSWLGRRHGIAMWEHDGMPYGVVNLASTDAGAAEDGMAKLRDAAEVSDEEFAYTVNDESVLIVLGEEGAADALAAAESEAGTSPLSDSAAYEEARNWLEGDQLMVYWVDMDALSEQTEEFGAGMMGMTAFNGLYSGQLIAGVSAFDDGFELTYRMLGGEDDPWTGSGDLLSNMGDLPASHLAVTADVPEDIAAQTDDWLTQFEELYGGGEAEAEAVEPSDGEPLTDAEYEEYLELDDMWMSDYESMSSEDEERYWELYERFSMYGTEDEPVDYGYDDYSYGPDWDEVTESVSEFTDLLAGSQLSFAADLLPDDDIDEESIFLQAVLADDRAAELNDLLEEYASGQTPEGIEADGSELSFTGQDVADGTLSDDARFSDFAADAPESSAVAVWVDMQALIESDPDDFEGDLPLSAFAWAHGSVDGDGAGLLRLYLE
ncbi:proline-rich domain-containing protein [Glycomyces buryatensis]|uniref:DUF3352 domain-containing protein n=1 Tax=Glycomyces buryatensis TaxID=2570927 RepID=A0A4S8QHC7_9ACTN|nr:proline-rich domain-containing protein [Glycomyces buryatensis]THV43141.1 hypothetical protein FAB82_02615 [Glycomyces buryatensis]